MKKNKLSIKFKPVKIFLEDLNEIEAISKELSIFKSIKIFALDHEFNSFSEIKDEYKECDDLSITIKKQDYGSFYITFSKYNNSIVDYDPDLETRGVIQKIYEVIEKSKKNKIFNFLKTIEKLKWLGYMGLFSSFFLKTYKTTLIVWSLFSGILLLSMLPIFFPVKSEILFVSRKERKSFWERNKDQLIVSGVVSIISLLVGFLLAKIK